MKRVVLVLLVFVSAWLGYVGYKKYKSFVPSTIVIDYKHVYSDAIRKDIDTFARKYLSSNDYFDFRLHGFYEKMREQFKIVRAVSWNWDSLDKVMITVEGVEPSFRVNDKYVYGNKEDLFPYSLFQSATLDNLHPLYLSSNEQQVPSRVRKFLEAMPSTCLQDYTVCYSSDNQVVLRKKQELYSLLVNDGTLAEQGKIEMVPFVHDDFMNRRSTEKWKKNWGVVYDLRFKNRIYAKIIRN